MHSWPAATSLMMLALSAATGIANAQASAPALPDDPRPRLSPNSVSAIDTSMERIVQNFSVPGLAIGIVEDGVPVYVRAFGVRDMETGRPVTVHTLFHVASITKTFTAAAVMQLAERNRLALTDPVGRHLPVFGASPITITQLLTHSAGLRDVNHVSATDDASAVKNYVDKIASRPPSYTPGQGWGYSDTSFNVLGAAIESASQQPFPQYLQANVLHAAGMVESTFAAPEPGGNFAWPHTGKVFVRRASRYPWDRALLPSTGLNASITDMTHWAAAHVNRDPALLSPASYDAMFKHQRDSDWQDMRMGLGWQLEQRGSQLLPRHAGEEHGFSALLTLYPESRRAIVILSNGENTPRGEIRNLIEAVLNGEAFIPPVPPLLLRRDFQWTLAGLAGMSLLLIAVTMRFRRRPTR